MPYIELKTNVTLENNQKEELIKAFGEKIELLPGKSEVWLMCAVEDKLSMSFKGDTSPCALATVSLFGKSTDTAYENLTAALCKKLSSLLGVDAKRIYVKYEEVSHWGFNGTNF